MTGSKESKCCVVVNKDKLEPPIAWLTLAAAFMTVMIGVGIPDLSIAIFYDYFVERFDVSRAAIGWVVSIYHVTGCLCGKLQLAGWSHYIT